MTPNSKLKNSKGNNEITTTFNKNIIDETKKRINSNKKKSNNNNNKLNWVDENKDKKTIMVKKEKELKNDNFNNKEHNPKNKNLIDKDNKMNKTKTQIKKINDDKKNTKNIQKNNKENENVNENNINNKNDEKNTFIASENIDNTQIKICKNCKVIKRKKHSRIKKCICLVHSAMNKKLDSIKKNNNVFQSGKTIKNKRNYCSIISRKKKNLLIIDKTFRVEFPNEAKKTEMNI